MLATSSKDKINDGQLLVTVAAKSIAKVFPVLFTPLIGCEFGLL